MPLKAHGRSSRDLIGSKRNTVSPIVRSWDKGVSDHGHHPHGLVGKINRTRRIEVLDRQDAAHARTMIRKAHSLQMLGRNAKVQKANKGAWEKWLTFCDAFNIKPIRDNFDANSGRDREGYAREVELLVTALVVTLRTNHER